MLSTIRMYGSVDSNLSIALQASIAGYIVNSMFHNGGPFVLDPFSWYLIGIISAFISSATVCNEKKMC